MLTADIYETIRFVLGYKKELRIGKDGAGRLYLELYDVEPIHLNPVIQSLKPFDKSMIEDLFVKGLTPRKLSDNQIELAKNAAEMVSLMRNFSYKAEVQEVSIDNDLAKIIIRGFKLPESKYYESANICVAISLDDKKQFRITVFVDKEHSSSGKYKKKVETSLVDALMSRSLLGAWDFVKDVINEGEEKCLMMG